MVFFLPLQLICPFMALLCILLFWFWFQVWKCILLVFQLRTLLRGEPSGKLREVIFGKCFPDPRQQGLTVAKLFYFFFFSAFGSLFPLMGVYFKQLGMDAAQAGFLSGIRPIIEYLATPFWSGISDR